MLLRLNYDKDTGEFHWKPAFVRAGYADPNGYIQIRFEGKLWQAHHIAFLLMTGDIPELVDHIDRDKHNNCWSNLREADKKLNAINSKLPSNNRSGVKGVSWHKAGKKWTAQIKHDGRKIHLGSYSSLLDAVEAREKAEEELWGELRGNEKTPT